ncbi:hypothetical protein AMECASPLE_033986 [Ameca splendens]|uniref:Uncharacterized protein n=1 Tax=Ameca splendens TaxID=208324 RepID=A0ABV1AGP7_9TELE
MKKITGFKQKEDRTDGCLDRTKELNTYFNRFSSETNSASSSSSYSQTDPPLTLNISVTPQMFYLPPRPWNFCFYMSTKSEDADAPFASTFHLCVSISQVKRQLS